MKLGKTIAISSALLLSSISAWASSAQFKHIRVETNTDHDGKKGVMIHADFDLQGAKDKVVQCQAIFYASPGGRALRDINDNYRLSPSLNYVSSSSYFDAGSNSMDVNGMKVFIPIEELHLQNPRKYRIYVKMSIYTNPGKTGEFLTESDYIPFIVDMADAQAPVQHFDYDPSQPVVVPELPKAQPAAQPEEPKFQPSNDEPERDSKGRPKRKKAKVFIS